MAVTIAVVSGSGQRGGTKRGAGRAVTEIEMMIGVGGTAVMTIVGAIAAMMTGGDASGTGETIGTAGIEIGIGTKAAEIGIGTVTARTIAVGTSGGRPHRRWTREIVRTGGAIGRTQASGSV